MLCGAPRVASMVHVILGNRLAGVHMWPDALPPPIVLAESGNNSNSELCGSPRGGFSMCCYMLNLSDLHFSVSCVEMVNEQRSDPSLKALIKTAHTLADVEDVLHGYFLDDGFLVRKWVSCESG